MKIALAHLTPAHFTQQIGRALDEEGMLGGFFTTLADEPTAWWQSIAKVGAHCVGFDLQQELRRRAVTEFPMSMVRTYPWRETARMILSKFSKSQVAGDHVFHWARDGFDSWVAGQLDEFDGVYGYETGSLEMFKRGSQLGITKILDLPSPEHDFVESILAPEYKRFPELKTAYRDRVVRLQRERTERRHQEWDLADLIIANSTFTANSWKAAGWAEKPVVVIPLGAPPVSCELSPGSGSGSLRCIWAGTFSVLKGAHYLIEAVANLNLSPESLVIDVYGARTLPTAIMQRASANFRFHDSVSRDELFAEMRKSDVMLFPTLCDGFGLVVNEAFAQGLPVIMTRSAGSADLLQEGVNGWLVGPRDSGALGDAIIRCLDQREPLTEMRIAAQRTALKWQWQDYRKDLTRAVRAAFEM